jgi:hypothetical protein
MRLQIITHDHRMASRAHPAHKQDERRGAVMLGECPDSNGGSADLLAESRPVAAARADRPIMKIGAVTIGVLWAVFTALAVCGSSS